MVGASSCLLVGNCILRQGEWVVGAEQRLDAGVVAWGGVSCVSLIRALQVSTYAN